MSKKEALELLEATLKFYELLAQKDPDGQYFIEAYKMAIETLRREVESKTGTWIPIVIKDDDCDCWGRMDSHTEFKCSNCSRILKSRTKYCPNCGEKKQEVEE